MTHLGFKEGLGPFDPLGGDVDLRETSEDPEAAVLRQLSCCRLPEDEEELWRKNRDMMETGGRTETLHYITLHVI